jgi:hypothetical protein
LGAEEKILPQWGLERERSVQLGEKARLLSEKAGLICGGGRGGRFAARDADDAKHGDLG